MIPDFEGRLALITGGGRGIGRAIALELARCGAGIVITYVRHPDAADAVAQEILELGRAAYCIRANVADETSVDRLFAEITERFGQLDFLINNAASGVNKPATDVTPKHWDWTLNTNARAAWLCARAALPLMQARGGGAVVSISSLGSSRVMPDYFLVGVSKAALEAVTRYLAVELAGSNVRVNAVSGGLVETDALKSFDWGGDVIAGAQARTPAGRLATPEDIARAVAFLCSDNATMIRGQTIVVDGGFSLLA